MTVTVTGKLQGLARTGRLRPGIVLSALLPGVSRNSPEAAAIWADPAFNVIEAAPEEQASPPRGRGEFSSQEEERRKDLVYLAAAAINARQWWLGALDEAKRQAAVTAVRNLVKDAYRIGARFFLVSSGPDAGPAKREEATDKLLVSLREVCAEAERRAGDYCLTVTLENFDREIDKRFLIGPTAEAARVAAEIRRDYGLFGLTIDQSHLAQLGEKPEEAFAAAAPYVVHLHLANCVIRDSSSPLYGDKHPPFGWPGGEHGAKEVMAFLRAWARVEAKPIRTSPVPVSVEVIPPAGVEWRAALTGAREILVSSLAALKSEAEENRDVKK